MRIKRKTRVVVQTQQITTVRVNREPILAWCERCAAGVEMVTPEGAASLADVKPRAIYARVENGELHFAETNAGELFICRRSLEGAETRFR